MVSKKCQVCNEAQSKYKCPSCFAPYCSLGCFKKHKEIPCAKPESKEEIPSTASTEEKSTADPKLSVQRPLIVDDASEVLLKPQLESIAATMLKIKTPKKGRIKRELEKRAPKLVETGKKTLILQGTKTSSVLNAVLTDLFHLKRDSAIRYTRKNDNVRPFESGGETSLEFFSLKTDCSIFVYGSTSKKRPDNLVLGRMYDHHVYDLLEVGVENFKSMSSFKYDKKIAPHAGSKPFIAFIGEGFESVDELKHLKEVLHDLFRGEVVENLNLAGLDRAYVCTAVTSNRVVLTHCAIRLKKSGTVVPRIELVEVGPSMDLVARRHRLPNESLRKEAMKTAKDLPKKKIKNVSGDAIQGKIGKIYIPDQKIGDMALPNKSKGVKRERREAKTKNGNNENASKKLKKGSS